MMRWCLAEAIRIQDQKFIAEAECVSLQQDVRGTRFLLRYRAVDSSLKMRSGTVHLRKFIIRPDLPGSTAVREATMKSIMHFTSARLPPRYLKNQKAESEIPKPDLHLAKRLVERVEVIAADAAADEQLALAEMANIAGTGDMAQLEGVYAQSFPNLKAGQIGLIKIFKI